MAINPEPEVLETTRATPATTAIATADPNAGLAVLGGNASGIASLALLTDDQFKRQVDLFRVGYERVKEIQRSLMRPGVHYGRPGGTAETIGKDIKEGKVGMYKAGSELLLQMFGFVAGKPDLAIEYGDPENTTSPAIVIHATVHIHRGSTDGPIVGVGVGAWSTWETKNRYRTSSRKCPQCGKSVLFYQKEARGGPNKGKSVYWCTPRREGCGAEFLATDPAIADQAVGREVNTEASDLLNTGVKMSAKRARIDGTISATGSSDLFTQDLEDIPGAVAKEDRPADAPGAPGPDVEVDPDAWRAGVITTEKPAPAVTPATAAAATPAASAPEPATPFQLEQITKLAKEKLDLDPENMREGIRARWNTGIDNAREAAKVFFLLKELPAIAAPANVDEAKKRAGYVDRINQLVAVIRACEPSRRVFDDAGGQEPLEMLVDEKALQVLGMIEPQPLDTLSMLELETLGKFIHTEAAELQRAARSSGRGTRSRSGGA